MRRGLPGLPRSMRLTQRPRLRSRVHLAAEAEDSAAEALSKAVLQAGGLTLVDRALRCLLDAGAVPMATLDTVASLGNVIVYFCAACPAAAVAEDAKFAAAADWVGLASTAVKLARVAAMRTRRLLPGTAHAFDGLALVNMCRPVPEAGAALQGQRTKGCSFPAVGDDRRMPTRQGNAGLLTRAHCRTRQYAACWTNPLFGFKASRTQCTQLSGRHQSAAAAAYCVRPSLACRGLAPAPSVW